MSKYDMTWAQVNRPVFRKSYGDRLHAWMLRWVIKAYKFEREIAINPQVRQGLSRSICELEGSLHRLEASGRI